MHLTFQEFLTAKQKLWEIIRSNAEPKIKADAGEILGRLGDDRDLENDIFIPIEGGEYELSTGKAKIEPFEMAKYPVTNGWYRKFIEAGGYQNPDFWSENGRKWLKYTKVEYPRFWYDHKWNCNNRPVVGVCWWEADAFLPMAYNIQPRWLHIPIDYGAGMGSGRYGKGKT